VTSADQQPLKPIVIRQARWKEAIQFVISSGLSFAGALALSERGSHQVTGAFCLVLFGASAIAAAIQIAMPGVLMLDARGFSVDGSPFAKPRRVSWQDITRFEVVSASRGPDRVGYAFRHDEQLGGALQKISSDHAGKETLPPNWPGSAQQLAGRLNEYRQYALALAGYVEPDRANRPSVLSAISLGSDPVRRRGA
jgi:hypothetical protein